jgi:hypothetical protein
MRAHQLGVPKCVPKLFPDAFAKMFPIAPEFYPRWFAQRSTPMYINQKPKGSMRKHIFILGTEANLGLYVGVVPNVPKILVIRAN